MIMYRKTNPVGIDKFIDRLQILQQREFPTLFGVSETTCLFYGRAEKLDDKFIIYISGNNYKEIGFDNEYNFISYIILDGISDHTKGITKQRCELYCHGNLPNLYSTITHRADEELRNEILEQLQRLVEFSLIKGTEIIEKELQPFHSFKIIFDATY